LTLTRVVPDDPTSAVCAGSADVTVANHPYFKVLGGDLISYGTFVRGYNQQDAFFVPTGCSPAIRCGAGVETAVQAQGTIAGVPSRYKQASTGATIKGLTYANSIAADTWGGGFGAVPPGINYTVPAGLDEVTDVDDIPRNANTEYLNMGTLAGGNIELGARATIYRSGNILIRNNITYGNRTGYAGSNDIPHLRIVATGHIFIHPDVTQLDGEFIALGEVYTCHNGTNNWTTNTNIHGPCSGSTLIVNGSLIGDSIKLTRMVGTRRAAQATDGNTGGCTTPTTVNNGYCNGTAANNPNIAEIIQFTPELFIARPASSPTNGNQTGKYNSITSLPPLF
jgi:hypothetical protein